MKTAWFLFKLLEMFLGIICIVIHIRGFLDDREPLPHHMYFCGTFCGFTFISMFGDIGICVNESFSLIVESVVTGCGAFFYLLSSVFSMHHAENDFHLMYLSDLEEAVHPFFAICKSQSITALICGVLFLLHCIFAIDALTITEKNYVPPESPTFDEEANKPIQLTLFCWDVLGSYECSQSLINSLRHFTADIFAEERKAKKSYSASNIMIV